DPGVRVVAGGPRRSGNQERQRCRQEDEMQRLALRLDGAAHGEPPSIGWGACDADGPVSVERSSSCVQRSTPTTSPSRRPLFTSRPYRLKLGIGKWGQSDALSRPLPTTSARKLTLKCRYTYVTSPRRRCQRVVSYEINEDGRAA